MRTDERDRLPWLEFESYRVALELARVARRVARRRRRRLPLTADILRDAADGIGGRLVRSSVLVGGPTRRLLERASALRQARRVQRELMRLRVFENGAAHADETAAMELAERVIELIRVGR